MDKMMTLGNVYPYSSNLCFFHLSSKNVAKNGWKLHAKVFPHAESENDLQIQLE